MLTRPSHPVTDPTIAPAGLPDPLAFGDGRLVRTADDWPARRAELLALFEQHVYGRTPSATPAVAFEVVEASADACEGRATRKQVVARIGNSGLEVDLLLYLPNQRQGPAPLFLGLNFYGNHTVTFDPAVRLPRSWVPEVGAGAANSHCASQAARGASVAAWPIEEILARGYGVATLYCGDLDPDYDDGFADGIHPLFYSPGQTRPADDEWGTIGAWAWGLSRAMDYIASDADCDAARVAVMGHSRLGKTALWAGAQDERFALVISNNSGCGGAALSRRRMGETLRAINERFPHWFCRHFWAYNDREDALPIDQHQLLALAAPRPVYVASAEDDAWADPTGEYVSARLASPVYALLGHVGLPGASMPGINQPLMGRIGYHLRSGGHAVTPYDWRQFIAFADLHLTPRR